MGSGSDECSRANALNLEGKSLIGPASPLAVLFTDGRLAVISLSTVVILSNASRNPVCGWAAGSGR